MNDGDVGISCSLGKNVFVSILLVIFLRNPLRGSADQVRWWGTWTGGQCFRVTPVVFFISIGNHMISSAI